MTCSNVPTVDLTEFAEMMLMTDNAALPAHKLAVALCGVGRVLKEARVFMKERKPQEAIDLLSHHIEAHPRNYQLMIATAKAYKAMADTSLAYEWTEKALEASPGHPGPYIFLLQVDLRNRNYPRAKSREKALRVIAPESSYHLYAKALLAVSERKFMEADHLLTRAVKLAPKVHTIRKSAEYVEKTLAKLKMEGPIPPRKFNRSPR